MESLGLRPGRLWALVAGLAEAVGGLLFGLGFLTPLAAVLISGVMLVAIIRVHGSKGLWAQNGGYEYPLVHLALTVGVGLAGPGYALDTYFRVALPVVPTPTIGLTLAAIVVAVSASPAKKRAESNGVSSHTEETAWM